MKGTIRKRGDKYQVIFPYKDEYDNWKQKSKTCDTKSIANATLKRMNYEVTDALLDNPRMSELAKLWISEVKLHGSANTIKAYEGCSRFVIDRLGDMRVKDIERKDIVELYQQIVEEGFEVKAYKTNLNMMMNFAIKSRYITVNPGKGITIKRTNEQRPAKILSMGERIALLSEMSEDLYYVTFLLLRTGLRIGEALGLRWKVINLDDKTMNIEKQLLIDNTITDKLKTDNSKRVIYLDTETMDMLRELSSSPYTSLDYIFDRKTTIRSRMTYALAKHGISAHDLRHNHGTDLLDICNIADAATRMGHTVEEYVSTYVHPSDESQKKIADALDNEKFSFCDRFLTEHHPTPSNVSHINASRRSQ